MNDLGMRGRNRYR